MEENSRPMGESPNGIAMPDAAITGPGRSGSAFVYVTFLPSPFGPALRANDDETNTCQEFTLGGIGQTSSGYAPNQRQQDSYSSRR